jgi:hypothetical protein
LKRSLTVHGVRTITARRSWRPCGKNLQW